MLPSILLPRGLVLGPIYILPAHPVGNSYWVGEALESTPARNAEAAFILSVLKHGRLQDHRHRLRVGDPTASANSIAYMSHILRLSQRVIAWRLRNAGFLCG